MGKALSYFIVPFPDYCNTFTVSHLKTTKVYVWRSPVCFTDACDLTLDPNTAGERIILTEENQTATYDEEKPIANDQPDVINVSQVLCKEGLSGRHYWEVECESGDVGVAYKSIPMNGDSSLEIYLGGNYKSWCWNTNGSFHHNNSPQIFLVSDTRNIGVYLDWPAGILSFFEVCPETLTHLYTLHTTFTEPLHPGFRFDSGSVHLRKKVKNDS